MVRLGLGANWRQFALLVVINAFVGALLGQERALLPIIAQEEFGIAVGTAATAFVAAFGAVKALSNLLAGPISERVGRRPVLIAGWLLGLPVPIILAFAPTWSWVVAANLFLGANQGLAWSMTVTMKVDLVGPGRRGLALGLNEFAGYVAVGVAAWGSAALAGFYGGRPVPFVIGLVAALAGLVLSVTRVGETLRHAHAEVSALEAAQGGKPLETASELAPAGVFSRVSWGDRRLFALAQAGLFNNLNDALAWSLLPVFFAGKGLDITQVGVLAGTYPLVWGITQLGAGAASDRLGRTPLIAAGLALQALALVGIALGTTFPQWLAWSAAYGFGTGLAYPVLLAAVADAAHPSWRATALGVYRFWRDSGFVVGSLAAGLISAAAGIDGAIYAVGALTLLSAGVCLAVAAQPKSQVSSP